MHEREYYGIKGSKSKVGGEGMNTVFDENMIWILIILFLVLSLSSTNKKKIFGIKQEEKEKVDYIFRRKRKSKPTRLVY